MTDRHAYAAQYRDDEEPIQQLDPGAADGIKDAYRWLQ